MSIIFETPQPESDALRRTIDEHYRADDIAMEPKPPQGSLPLWVGGGSPAALRRTGQLGDGWMGTALVDTDAHDALVTSRSIKTVIFSEYGSVVWVTSAPTLPPWGRPP